MINATKEQNFKSSVVTDEKGELLLVYHGTDKTFTEFDRAAIGSNTAADNTGMGFFFIADRDAALGFSEATSGGTTLIAAYLTIKKPINLTTQGIFTEKEQASTLWEIFTGEVLDNDEALDAINEEIGLGEIQDVALTMASDHAKEILKREGYDGAISDFGGGHIEYIVFEPHQIDIVSIEHDALIEAPVVSRPRN